MRRLNDFTALSLYKQSQPTLPATSPCRQPYLALHGGCAAQRFGPRPVADYTIMFKRSTGVLAATDLAAKRAFK